MAGAVGHLREFFVGGRWEPAAGDLTRRIVDPATEEVVAEVSIGEAADAAAAVQAAKAAFPAWSALTGAQRADHLERFAEVWEAHAEEIGAAISREMGMPVGMSGFFNGFAPAQMLRYYAQLARTRVEEEDRVPAYFRGSARIRPTAAGVVAAIAPWNYAATLLASKFAPALAAGCTIVIKPAEENGVSARIIGRILDEADLPPGVVNVVPGGPDFAAALVANPDVARVAFTGSTGVGRTIARTVGERLATVNLELGGKSAAVVLDDADLDVVARDLPPLAFQNSGQTCFAQTRVVATPGVYDAVVRLLVDHAQGQRLGSPFDTATTMGPLGTGAQRERVRRAIAEAVDRGAVVEAGGRDAAVPERGFYVAPTVLTGVRSRDDVAQQEIFGPVVVVIAAEDDDDAVRIANDSPYGLAGSVWTADTARGLALARRIEAGTVGVNGYQPDAAAPWGGVKDSGQGRENGPEALESYLVPRTYYLFDHTPDAPG